MNWPSKDVEYRPLEAFPDHCVGADGSVWRLRKYLRRPSRWSRLSVYRRPYGARYCVVCIRDGVGSKAPVRCRYIHRLVLEAFVGAGSEGMQGCHYDGDTSNNSLANLRWDTPKANAVDTERQGRRPRGSRHGAAKITEDDVREIHRLRREGLTQAAIGARYNRHQSDISDILRGRRWNHVYRELHQQPQD